MDNTAKSRLLVVDDETDLRDLLAQYLGSRGYEVVSASDGDEAVKILGRESFDAALVDILMPRRSGMEVLRHISRHHPAMKSIVLTGYTDLKTAVEAKQLGAADYITKPYKLEMVLSALEQLLGPRG
jgi:DNA-binding NtrC family response regulator